MNLDWSLQAHLHLFTPSVNGVLLLLSVNGPRCNVGETCVKLLFWKHTHCRDGKFAKTTKTDVKTF